jgi:hypothetical protein
VKIAIALALLAGVASADSPHARAEALFRQGRDLLAAGKTEQACAAFDASQKLDPATTTLFNQADCREKNKQLATAWGLFVEAERQTRGATDDVGVKLHEVAQKRARAIESRLSKISITVTTPVDGLVVLRDGEQLDAAELGTAQPIDGGTHNFTARVGAREVWAETVTIKPEHDTAELSVTVQGAKRTEPAGIPAVATTPASPMQPAPSRTSAIAATVGAGVLLGGALVFDLWGNSLYDDAVAMHDQDEWGSANTRRYVAQGLLVGGIGCAAVATWLWLRKGDVETAHVVVVPVVTTGFAGVQLARGW